MNTPPVPAHVDNLVSLLQHRADAQPDKLAYRFLRSEPGEPLDLTYRGLLERAAQVAAGLSERNVRGQPVLLVHEAGLEFLVAGDIIRTVAISPTFASVGVLAVIVLVRTFLSWTIELEIEGRWPWQGRADGATPDLGA